MFHKHMSSWTYPYEKELYQNICDIYLKYIAHICKLYVFTMSVYVSYMYMLHICRSNIYVNIWEVYGTDIRRRKQVNQLQVFEIDQLN